MALVADEILEARGLDFDQLSDEEKTDYFKWLDEETKATITLETVKTHVRQMKYIVELQLVQTEPYKQLLFFKIPNQKHAQLKARLHNYLLLEGLLSQPERAKQALEAYKRPARL